MRTTVLCVAVMFIVSRVDAAPAPAPGLKAKETLEALKKRLPDVVRAWAKERWYPNEKVEVRVVRMLGPSQAKVVLMSREKESASANDKVFTIFLDFYDGYWSTIRFDASWAAKNDFENRNVRFLMLAIDEAVEK